MGMERLLSQVKLYDVLKVWLCPDCGHTELSMRSLATLRCGRCVNKDGVKYAPATEMQLKAVIHTPAALEAFTTLVLEESEKMRTEREAA